MTGNGSLVAGIVVGILSLAAAAFAGAQQIHYGHTLATSGYPLVPVATELLPPGNPPQPERPPLTTTQRDAVRKALWREPLDQKLGNLIYVDKVQSGVPTLQSAAQAVLLARTGWRYTPAQQNLLMRAAFDGRFDQVVDRADSLLRRQKLTPLATTMLATMEAIPQVRGLVIAKLQGKPMWRLPYLAAINPQTPPAVIDARAATLRVLLRDRGAVDREEIAPLIGAMVATGKASQAHALWRTYDSGTGRANILADTNFRLAAALNAAGRTPVAFEWSFFQGLGYAASPAGDGVTLSWDGRGGPLFMTQTVALRAGARYVLRIAGTGDVDAIRRALAPTIICGAVTVRFDPVAGGSLVGYRSEAIPADCAIGVLSIVGNLDSGRRNVDLLITRMELLPAV